MRSSLTWCAGMVLLCLGLSLAPFSGAWASQSLQVEIHGPGQKKVNFFLAQPRPLEESEEGEIPEHAQGLEKAVESNLSFLPFLHRVEEGDLLGEGPVRGLKGQDIDFKRLRMSKVDFLFTLGYRSRRKEKTQMELRVFSTRSGELFVGRGYVLRGPEQARIAARRFCAEVMEELTGKAGFFRSRLAYVRKQGKSKEIFTSTSQGDDARQITDYGALSLSPAWSWDGENIAFTLIQGGRHKLRVFKRQTQEIRDISLPGNTIISPAFRPDGTIAVSTDPKGNPDIYEIEDKEGLGRTLERSWAIDISPEFDREGQLMVFVSSRLGNPHIFLKDFQDNKVSRISYQGDYNTSPALSPDGRYIAFSRLTEEGHRIFLHDRKKESTKQLTHGPGNDEDPAFGPDGYFLAFASSRQGQYGLYLTSRQGGWNKEVPIEGDSVKSPAWSPVLRD